MRRLPIAVVAVVAVSSLLGCSHQPSGRNPAFAAVSAPEPTVLVAPINCSSLRTAYVDVDGDARGVVNARFGAAGVEVSAEQRAALCAIVVHDEQARRGHWDDGRVAGQEHGDWDEGPLVTTAVHAVAEQHAAKSLLVTLELAVNNCKDFEIMNGYPGCGDATGLMVRTVLFAPDGTVLWRSHAERRIGSDHDVEIAFGRALDQAPAKIVKTDDDAGDGKFDVDALISRELGPAPDECKEIARRFCQKTTSMIGDVAVGESTCKTFVSAQRVNYRASGAKQMCAAALR